MTAGSAAHQGASTQVLFDYSRKEGAAVDGAARCVDLYPSLMEAMTVRGWRTPRFVGCFAHEDDLPETMFYPPIYWWLDTKSKDACIGFNEAALGLLCRVAGESLGIAVGDDSAEVRTAITKLQDVATTTFEAHFNALQKDNPDGANAELLREVCILEGA